MWGSLNVEVCPLRVRTSFLSEVSFLERERPHPYFSSPVYRVGGKPFPVGPTQSQGSQKGRLAWPPKRGRIGDSQGIPVAPVTLVPPQCFRELG